MRPDRSRRLFSNSEPPSRHGSAYPPGQMADAAMPLRATFHVRQTSLVILHPCLLHQLRDSGLGIFAPARKCKPACNQSQGNDKVAVANDTDDTFMLPMWWSELPLLNRNFEDCESQECVGSAFVRLHRHTQSLQPPCKQSHFLPEERRQR